MSGRVFINYRRGDDPGSAGRLFDALQQAFGAERLFIDVDDIEPGLDFVQVIEERLAQSDVLLAVIGSRWSDVRDADGNRRLDNPSDFVRLELEIALAHNKRVIPVLVGDARMLSPVNLPESLRPLTRRNAVQIRHERFRSDTEALIKVLKRILDDSAGGPGPQTIEPPAVVPPPAKAPEPPPPPPAAVPVSMIDQSAWANSQAATAPVKPVPPASRRIAYLAAALMVAGIGAFAFFQTSSPPSLPKETSPAPTRPSSDKSASPATIVPAERPVVVAPAMQPPATKPAAQPAAVIAPTIKRYDTGATDTEIKIGNIAPYSKSAFHYGAIGKVEEAYFRKINEAGGINGRKINFISYDDEYLPTKAVEQTRKLVEGDQVLLIFGVLGPYSNNAIQKYLNSKQTPHLFAADGASRWGDPQNFPWTMGWRPNFQIEGRIFAKYILQNKPDGKIAILYQNNDYFGKDYLKGFKDGLGAKAATMIVGEESYDLSEDTADAQVARLKSTGADVFMNFSITAFAAQAIQKAAKIGWKPLHFVSSEAAIGAGIIARDDAQGIISAAYAMDPSDPQWKDDPATKEWTAFKKNYNSGAAANSAEDVYAYNLARTLVQVLTQCGDDLTRANVMKQAANLKDFTPGLLLPGIRINTSPTDFYPIEQMQLIRLDGAAWKPLGPIVGATR